MMSRTSEQYGDDTGQLAMTCLSQWRSVRRFCRFTAEEPQVDVHQCKVVLTSDGGRTGVYIYAWSDKQRLRV